MRIKVFNTILIILNISFCDLKWDLKAVFLLGNNYVLPLINHSGA